MVSVSQQELKVPSPQVKTEPEKLAEELQQLNVDFPQDTTEAIILAEIQEELNEDCSQDTTQPQDSPQDDSKFLNVLEEHFPGAILEEVFLERLADSLHKRGFTKDNSLAMTCVCRDELTLPFVKKCSDLWGNIFNMSSLAGMVFCGKTGFLAATNHSPRSHGRERYIILVASHIAINEDGEIGKCSREGRPSESSACGALRAFLSEVDQGKLNLKMDLQDVEQCLLKQVLIENIPFGKIPSLLELTYLAHKLTLESTHALFQSIQSDLNPHDYAVISGIQIHSPAGTYFWSGKSLVCVDDLDFEELSF
jgi:hypothetical protein